MMSISLTDFVDSVAGERIAELEAEVEKLQGKLDICTSLMSNEQLIQAMAQEQAKGESDATR